jgi:hypothetical protein
MRFFSGRLVFGVCLILPRIRSSGRLSSSRLPGLDRRQSCQLSSQPRQTQRRGHKNKSRRAPPALPRSIKTRPNPAPSGWQIGAPQQIPHTRTRPDSDSRLPSPKAQGGLAGTQSNTWCETRFFRDWKLPAIIVRNRNSWPCPVRMSGSPFGHNASKQPFSDRPQDDDAWPVGRLHQLFGHLRRLNDEVHLRSMVDFARMLALNDHRWTMMTGGYRTPLDPRPLLSKLESARDTAAVWAELWDELHHQGDVGDASYAAVPHLADIYRRRGQIN